MASEIHENNKGFFSNSFPESFPVLENPSASKLQGALIKHSHHPLPLSHDIARAPTSKQTILQKGKGKGKEEEEDNEQSTPSHLHFFNTKTDPVMQTSAVEEYNNLFTTPAPPPTQLPHFPAIKILNPTLLLPIYSDLELSDPNLAPKHHGTGEFRTVRCWEGSLRVVLDDTAEELTITGSTPSKKDVYPHLMCLLYAKLAAIGEEWEREREAWAHADDQDQEAERFERKLEPQAKIEDVLEHENATARTRRPSWGDRVNGEEDVSLEGNWGARKRAQKVEEPTDSFYEEQECKLDYDMQSEVTESEIQTDSDSQNTKGGASISSLDLDTERELASNPSTSYCTSADQASSPFSISLLDDGMNPMHRLSPNHVEEDLILFYDSETSCEPGALEREYNSLCSRDLYWGHILSRREGIVIDEKKRDEVEENLIDF